MSEAEFLGMMVIAIASLVALFFAIHKPLSDNTKAMTELTIKLEYFTQQLEQQEKEFKEYKEHVSEGQRKQWDAINKHSDKILEHDKDIKQIKDEMEV